MKFFRKIIKCKFTKEKSVDKDKLIKVYVPACGWGEITELNEKGSGYISFFKGGGQLINDWNHFFNMIQTIDLD